MKHEEDRLIDYIAAYVNEELDRGKKIDAQTIRDAIAAFHGGAR